MFKISSAICSFVSLLFLNAASRATLYSEILAKVDGVYNAKGAGMDPTASAVVADIVKIVTRNHIVESSPFELINQIENYYIILANDISKNEINEILKDAKEKLVLRIMK